MPFNLRNFEEEAKAKMGVHECVTHKLVEPFQVLYEKHSKFRTPSFSYARRITHFPAPRDLLPDTLRQQRRDLCPSRWSLCSTSGRPESGEAPSDLQRNLSNLQVSPFGGQSYSFSKREKKTTFNPTTSPLADEIVAQFKNTVLILPNGLTVVTGSPFDLAAFSSEHSVQDEEMKKLLAEELVLADAKKSVVANLVAKAAAAADKPASAAATPASAEGGSDAAPKKKNKKKKKAAAAAAAAAEGGDAANKENA